MTDLPDSRFAETRRECARWFGITSQCLDNWTGKGCPTVASDGRGTRFDLLEVARWRYGTPETEPGIEILDPRTEKAKLDRARREEVEMRLQEKAGKLIPAAEFERALSAPLKTVAMTLESLPDLLERDAGIDGAAVDRVIVVVDSLRETLFKAIVDGAT